MASLRFSSLPMLAARFSPRTRWIAGTIAVAALLYGAFVYWERSAWRPLPHGGEARLFQIGYGERMRLKQRGLQLTAARNWLGPRFEFLLGPKPFELRSTFRKRSLFVAFASRGSTVDDLPSTGYCEIDLPGGQILRGAPSTLGNVRNDKIDLASFPVVPFSQKWLNVRLEFGGESLPFRLRNPAYAPRPAPWKAQPLPQTQTVGNVMVTLNRVSVSKTYDSGAGSFWEARPEYSVDSAAGLQSTKVYTLRGAKFCDPFGNESERTALFYEPVWKVRVSFFRPHNDDVPDSEVRWLERVPLPGPGEGRVFIDAPGTPGARRHIFGLVGPGHYHLISGKLIPVPTPPDFPPAPLIQSLASPFPDGQHPGQDIFELHIVTTTLLSIGFPSAEEQSSPVFADTRLVSPALFLRDQSGRRVEFESDSYGYSELRPVTVLPGATHLEIGLMPREVHADFYIAAPAPPPE